MKTVQVHLIVWTTLVEFCGEAQFQIITQKWMLGNIQHFVRFKLKSLKLKIKNLDRTLIYPNTDQLPTSFLVV